VVIDGNTAHFYLKRSKGFSNTGAGEMQRIDMGIGLCHFALAAQEQGLNINFAINDPGMNTASDTEYIASYTLAE